MNILGNTSNRIFGLDILRACAIMFVVIGHGTSFLPQKLSKLCKFVFGYDGVSIFFVLSGFLIGGLLIKILEKSRGEKKALLKFWIRRWFRTLPPYFLILILLLILNISFEDSFNLRTKLKFAVTFSTFTQNLFYNHPGFFPEAWSLAIEEWFYLIIPPFIYLFVFFKKSPKLSFLFAALITLVAVTLFRISRYYNFPNDIINQWDYWDAVFRKQVITRLDSLMYGMIGAFLQFYYREYWLKYKKSLLCFGLFLFVAIKYLIDPNVSFESMYYCVFSFSVTSFATLLLLPYLSDFRTNKNGLIYKSITTISLVSYSMYLINLSLVQLWIINKIPWQDLKILSKFHLMLIIPYIIYWFLTIFLSMVIYKYYEVPMMNLRDNKTVKKWLRL